MCVSPGGGFEFHVHLLTLELVPGWYVRLHVVEQPRESWPRIKQFRYEEGTTDHPQSDRPHTQNQ